MDAALKGAEQIGFTIISLTVSLIAVLIPLLFMGDVVGRLFREFAVTLAVTIIISAVVSLTLTPMMAARILRHEPKEQQGRIYQWSERGFERMIAFYGRTLKKVLEYQTITLLVALGTLVLTVFLYIMIPKGFFPVQDTGVIQGISQAPETIAFQAMAEKQQELAKVILADPAVQSLSSFIGADGTNTTLNSGRMSINLKALPDRDHTSASDIIRRLQSKLQNVQGIQLFMQPVQNITVDDRVSRTQYQYSLEDPDANELNTWSNRFVAKLKALKDVEDVATDQQTGGLAVSLIIDRATASRLGIAPATIDNTLYDAFGQRQINTMYTQLNQYHVILEAQPQFQTDPNTLLHMYIQANASAGTSGPGASTSFSASGSSSAGSNATTAPVLYTPSSGALTAPTNALSPSAGTSGGSSSANTTSSSAMSNAVPLSTFTHFTRTSEALSINHQGQFPAVTVSFNLAPNASLGDAITAIDKVQKDMHMPASLQADFQGTAASFKNSLSGEALLILAALVTVYIVLGVLYESFIHPVTILSTLPSAGVGALLALMLFRQDLSVVAIIGIILLIGIVKKNGIMMVDFALEAEREHGKNATEAIYEASLLRFRPIMMTTMAALLGGIPLAFGRGIGSEIRRPLGIAMVGGLLLSQALTLYTTPVIYIFFDGLGERFSRWRSGSHETSGGAEHPAEPA
jgi:multidrug efflux pump